MKWVFSITCSLALAAALCVVGAEFMGNQRSKPGRKRDEYRAKNAARERERRKNKKAEPIVAVVKPVDLVAEGERERCKSDFLYLYDEYFAPTVRDRKTKQLVKRTLSEFHYIYIDFQHLDIIEDVKTYSCLKQYLPPRDENGDYPERWLYWKTLDAPPAVQDGATGKITTMFYDDTWQGIVIRVKGDGRTKSSESPRGHLKSTIGACETMQRSLRDPLERHAIRCNRDDLAKQFLGFIKQPFERNDRFRELFGHLKSEKREGAWNTTAIEYRVPEKRSADPTIQTAGLETDMTGMHYDNAACDDVVSEKNSKSPALLDGVRCTVSAMHAQRDPYSNFDIRGTKWEDDDAFVMYTGKPGASEVSGILSEETCFFRATVLDGDVTVEVPPLPDGRVVALKGCGKPFFWDMRTVLSKRRATHDDRFYFCQYFNQTAGTSNKMFHRAWIHRFPKELAGMSPQQIARALKLNIFIAFDLASAKEEQKGKLDHSAGLVLGQTLDCNYLYVLDGFREKLPAEQVAPGLVDLAMKWSDVVNSYKVPGTLLVGFEKTAYTNFLKVTLVEEQKKRGALSCFSFREIQCRPEAKPERIKELVDPYSNGAILWPEELMVTAVRQTKDQETRGVTPREPYDLIKMLEGEWLAYNPRATSDDLLDAHVYAYELAFPTNWKTETGVTAASRYPGMYSRQDAHNEGMMIAGLEAYEGSMEMALE